MATPTTAPPVAANRPAAQRPGGGRLSLRVLGVALSVLLVVWGALSLASLLARVTETRSATFSGVASLELDLGFESVEIVGSTSVTSVAMDRSYTWSMVKPSIGARQDGDRLVLTSSCPFTPGVPCSGRVRLLVPAELRVQGDTGDGHLTLRDLTGPVTVATGDGGVDVSEIGGLLSVTTRDGSVDATELRSTDLTVTSQDGDVRLAFSTPPTSVRTDSQDGSVDVTVPKDGTSYDVVTDTRDGSRQVSLPTDPSSARRIVVRTQDGGIRVADAP